VAKASIGRVLTSAEHDEVADETPAEDDDAVTTG
jgi:hypothetical protein